MKIGMFLAGKQTKKEEPRPEPGLFDNKFGVPNRTP
jgi:hypothetical protein